MAQTHSQDVRSGRTGRWRHWLERQLIDSVLRRIEGLESGTLTVTLPDCGTIISPIAGAASGPERSV